MALKGYGDTTIDQIKLDGKDLDAKVRDALIGSPSIERSIARSSTIRMTLKDTERDLLKSDIFAERLSLTYDELVFDFFALSKRGNELDLTFENAAIADLRRIKGPRKSAAKTTTRVQFAKEIVREVRYMKFRGDDDRDKNLKAITQGKHENGFKCCQRLADERQWRFFVDEETAYFGSDDWLLELTEPFVLKEDGDGVISIDFEYNGGKQANNATITCFAKTWAARPGAPINLNGLGSLASKGLWLVESISRPLDSQVTTVTLVRKTPELEEPKPDVNHDDRGNEGQRKGDSPGPGKTSEGWQWPVRGPITSGFGPRGSDFHYGLDIDGQTGDPIRASRDGTVGFAGVATGYGNVIYIEHSGGYQSRYAHLSDIDVRSGQKVDHGSVIGKMGATGNATGSHLHFEIRVGGVAKDPLQFLP